MIPVVELTCLARCGELLTIRGVGVGIGDCIVGNDRYLYYSIQTENIKHFE